MRLRYLGHSAFLLTSDAGVCACIDPYRFGDYEGALAYAPIEDEIDVAIISHDHADHNAVDALAGQPLEARADCRVRGLELTCVATWHDEQQGALRGPNNVLCLAIDGLRVVHCGDLGHMPTAEQAAAIGRPDLLLVPVGGTYTLDALQARALVALLTPRVVIPMHYKTPAIGFPLAGPEAFCRQFANVRRVGPHEHPDGLMFRPDLLPADPCVLWLDPTHG